MLRITSPFGVVAGLLLGLTSTCLAGAPPIGNDQHFVGQVNGLHAKAVVYVVCPGPVWQGRTGHPSGNQNFSVKQVVAGGGYTGHIGGGIFARFATNPPTEGVLFTTYGTLGPIPVSWTVPCSGTGRVVFSPLPIVSGSGASTGKARPDIVAVTFENIAV